MLIIDAEIYGRNGCAVRCTDGLIAEIGAALRPTRDERVIDARGGALVPGLHDHHLHLFALAGAQHSVFCGPPQVTGRADLAQALSRARPRPGSRWIRGIGYHESVAGELTRDDLDQLVPDTPLRLQHRSGKMWMVNSPGAARLCLDSGATPPGVERDRQGRATGRLFRLDDWLGEKTGDQEAPDLAVVSAQLARFGVAGFTDATPGNDEQTARALARSLDSGEIAQRIHLMGGPKLTVPNHGRLSLGPVKLFLDEDRLPDFDSFVRQMIRAHELGRAVAIHCVTQTELIFALTGLKEARSLSGDRIEHASLTPGQAFPLLKQTGVTVVTQHGFIFERGESYLRDVPETDHRHLYRGQSFLAHAIPLAGGTDAPYGPPDPWAAMRAAVGRTTDKGAVLGRREALTPEQALALFTTDAALPGGPPRLLKVGAKADLCLLHHPWAQTRERLVAKDVTATVVGGQIIYERQSS